MTENFHFESLVQLCRQTHEEMQGRASHFVNLALVIRNWLFGWYIVEFEQNGSDRAEYGQQLIERLGSKLRIKGASNTNLRKFRQFYREYPIQQAVSVESLTTVSVPANWQAVSVELSRRFSLSWSHYVILLALSNPEERCFYEIEAREESWGSRELGPGCNTAGLQVRPRVRARANGRLSQRVEVRSDRFTPFALLASDSPPLGIRPASTSLAKRSPAPTRRRSSPWT